ncbi:uncharacterized protein LOC130172130 [Seriola aureovittata]|uniref:uncharacterized protein LOC130172130 n=1 Tax=Seriola aureovittata TaxID=2871759 RepID=UPI0024BEC2F6|nr:uncharacterized protein LOC130172130 [Seriola aureovittata]
METQGQQCVVPIHLTDHNYCRRRMMSPHVQHAAGRHRSCNKRPRCTNNQVQDFTTTPQHSATAASLPQKRKRTPVPGPSRPSAEPLGEMNLAKRLRSAISPADLPAVSGVTPRPRAFNADNQQSSADVNKDVPVKIHHHSVEEYQRIYHEVVDDMLKYKSGRVRPYSIQLGRCIKQKLWERLDRPMITTSANQDGLVHVDVSYSAGVYPPLYQIDTSREPKPGTARKRAGGRK